MTAPHCEFAVHILNEDGKRKARAIQNLFDCTLEALIEICVPGRELSLVRTKLEEACFYAKKAMAINLNNQTDRTALLKAYDELGNEVLLDPRGLI